MRIPKLGILDRDKHDFIDTLIVFYLGGFTLLIISVLRAALPTEFDFWYRTLLIGFSVAIMLIAVIFKFKRSRKLFLDYIDEIQLFSVAMLSAMGIYADIFRGEYGTQFFIILLLFTAFAIAMAGHNKMRRSEMERILADKDDQIDQLEDALEGDEIRKREEVKRYIRNLAENRLEFRRADRYDDRISLYTHVDALNSFMLYYRFSKNPELQKLGRRTYSDQLGAIRDAWQHGQSYREYKHSYDTDPDAYIDEVCKFDNLDRETVKNLTMHPKQLMAFRLDKGQDKYYGLIVIESNKEKRFDFKQVHQILNTCERSKGEVYEILGDLRTLLPSMMESSKEMGLENDV